MDSLPGWFPTVAGVALVAFGLTAAAWAVAGDVRRAIASRNWPGVEGLVTCSHVEVSGSGGDHFQKHKLVYRYVVDGVTHTGKRVAAGGNFDLTLFGGAGHAWSTAGMRQSRYAPGMKVHVLYNPANPKDCCLEPGGLLCAVTEVAVSLAIAAAGFHVLGSYA